MLRPALPLRKPARQSKPKWNLDINYFNLKNGVEFHFGTQAPLHEWLTQGHSPLRRLAVLSGPPAVGLKPQLVCPKTQLNPPQKQAGFAFPMP
jgi:hypothetical protein